MTVMFARTNTTVFTHPLCSSAKPHLLPLSQSQQGFTIKAPCLCTKAVLTPCMKKILSTHPAFSSLSKSLLQKNIQSSFGGCISPCLLEKSLAPRV